MSKDCLIAYTHHSYRINDDLWAGVEHELVPEIDDCLEKSVGISSVFSGIKWNPEDCFDESDSLVNLAYISSTASIDVAIDFARPVCIPVGFGVLLQKGTSKKFFEESDEYYPVLRILLSEEIKCRSLVDVSVKPYEKEILLQRGLVLKLKNTDVEYFKSKEGFLCGIWTVEACLA